MENNKSYFGLTVYAHGIKVDDIIMIPYDEYFKKVSTKKDGEQYIDLLTWERYAKKYIHKNNLIFSNGVYSSNYTFGENDNTVPNPNIFINSTELLDETRHIKLRDRNTEIIESI